MKKFYLCKTCGNLVGMIHSGGGQLVCCGSPMELLAPNTVDAATEKHLPVVKTVGTKYVVTVGEVAHPMTEEHLIEWIYLETQHGGKRVELKPGDEPKAEFCMNDEPIAAYAYCNLHGLWKTEL